MYIGPWQEYNLSRASNQQRVNYNTRIPLNASNLQTLNLNNKLKDGIEKAILTSVDPSVAEKAIQAVESFFASQQQPITTKALVDILNLNNTDTRHDFLNTTVNNRRRPRPGHQNHRKLSTQSNDSGSDNGRFPAISSAHSNRRSGQSSPLSVRSSQSEPNQNGVRLPRLRGNQRQRHQSSTNRNEPPNIKQANSQTYMSGNTTQSAAIQQARLINQQHQQQEQQQVAPPVINQPSDYNPRAVVNFLRHERRNKERETLEKLTGWNTSKTSSVVGNLNNTQNTLTVSGKQSQKSTSSNNGRSQEEVDQRIGQVNAMKDLYMKNIPEKPGISANNYPNSDFIIQSESTSSKGSSVQQHNTYNKIHLSDSPPKTPTIADMDITESELLLISKYFIQTSSSSSALNQQHSHNNHHHQNQGINQIKFDDDIILEGDEEESMEMGKKGTSPVVIKPVNIVNKSNTNSTNHIPTTTTTDNTTTTSNDEIGKVDLSNIKAVDTCVDELYMGGIDGLLKWSKQLDFDMSF